MPKQEHTSALSLTPWELDRVEADSTTLEELAKTNSKRTVGSVSRPAANPVSVKDEDEVIARFFGETDTPTVRAALEDAFMRPGEPDARIKAFFDRIDRQDQPGSLERLLAVIANGDWERARAIIWERFDQIHRPEEKAKFLVSYGRHWPEIAATDPLYQRRLPMIPILEASASTEAEQPPVANTGESKSKVPADTQKRKKSVQFPRYRSSWKGHVRNFLTDEPDANDIAICSHLDATCKDIPSSWLKNGTRELVVVYRTDAKTRGKVATAFSKIRRDLRLTK